MSPWQLSPLGHMSPLLGCLKSCGVSPVLPLAGLGSERSCEWLKATEFVVPLLSKWASRPEQASDGSTLLSFVFFSFFDYFWAATQILLMFISRSGITFSLLLINQVRETV